MCTALLWPSALTSLCREEHDKTIFRLELMKYHIIIEEWCLIAVLKQLS